MKLCFNCSRRFYATTLNKYPAVDVNTGERYWRIECPVCGTNGPEDLFADIPIESVLVR